MKWLALLLYVVLVLRLSNVADLRLLPLTPLLRFPLVEVEEHLEALLCWSEPETAEAVVQHAIVTECRQGRIPYLVPTALVRAGPRSSAPAVIRCGFVRKFVSEVDPMRFPARGTSDEDDPMVARRLEGPLVGLRDEMGTRTSETLAGPEPALLHMGSVVAVAKPAGWEVWGGHHPRQLWQHLQAVEGLRHGILRDAEHGHGFVHRLDVPGSGLVLFACGYEAYYDLKLQLALGQLERRYTVLSHGLATSRNVTAHVHWKDRGPKGIRELPSVSGGRGKPCGTEIVLRAHGFKEGRVSD
ncbi:hypothetical protein AK812_SmicGene19885 [Symbiodinium microadriaticum]|uniref:Pseudouridine synthase RsuA/RluA-like domain-containing protein n=1 Tax=Symbiodinium microadriaticum TaxID=2951 RepID=A0A1Q9DRE4_SYMMI|nr:hypothetical protein AK812_SmicGene19885 [Symbiodinium microadriaticum]